MKLTVGKVTKYGTFMNLTLAKSLRPGDGKYGRGVGKRGMKKS